MLPSFDFKDSLNSLTTSFSISNMLLTRSWLLFINTNNYSWPSPSSFEIMQRPVQNFKRFLPNYAFILLLLLTMSVLTKPLLLLLLSIFIAFYAYIKSIFSASPLIIG
ncbi:MAG: hypothetical protein MHPSP_001253, partial [Paramarteilia canceri]